MGKSLTPLRARQIRQRLLHGPPICYHHRKTLVVRTARFVVPAERPLYSWSIQKGEKSGGRFKPEAAEVFRQNLAAAAAEVVAWLNREGGESDEG